VLLIQLHNFFLSQGIFILSSTHNNLYFNSQPCISSTLINLTYTNLLEGTINVRILLCNNVYKFTFILNNSSYTNILQKFTEFSLDVGSHTICPNVVIFICKEWVKQLTSHILWPVHYKNVIFTLQQKHCIASTKTKGFPRVIYTTHKHTLWTECHLWMFKYSSVAKEVKVTISWQM
jgi:hypothetical protein